jgi:hypothetical protein
MYLTKIKNRPLYLQIMITSSHITTRHHHQSNVGEEEVEHMTFLDPLGFVCIGPSLYMRDYEYIVSVRQITRRGSDMPAATRIT